MGLATAKPSRRRLPHRNAAIITSRIRIASRPHSVISPGALARRLFVASKKSGSRLAPGNGAGVGGVEGVAGLSAVDALAGHFHTAVLIPGVAIRLR